MGEAAVQAVGLVKWFGAEDIRTYAVREVSFEVNFGEMLYITGPSGSGKTPVEHYLGDSETQCRHGGGGG